jgi:hypothetical protein
MLIHFHKLFVNDDFLRKEKILKKKQKFISFYQNRLKMLLIFYRVISPE